MQKTPIEIGSDFRAPASSLNELPKPFAWPLVGNLPSFLRSSPHSVLEAWAAEYGSMFTYRQGSDRVLCISDSELAKQILRSRPKTFRRHERLAQAIEQTGFRGVFTAEGDAWVRQRRLIMRGLTPEVVNAAYPHITTLVGRLSRRWQLESNDPQADLKRFSMDVVMWTSLGLDLNCIENPDQELSRAVDVWFDDISKRVRLPRLWYLIRERCFGFAARSAIADIRAAALRAIGDEEGVSDSDATPSGPKNILRALVEARKDLPSEFSDEDIIGNTVTMLLAGQETTASALSWALYYLAQNQKYCEYLRNSVANRFVDRKLGVDSVSVADIPAVPEVLRFCTEVMKLRPVAPMLGLTALELSEIGGLRIDVGQKIVLLLRDEKVRGGSKELSSFEPVSTDSPNEGNSVHDSGLVFGAGSRLCPGRYLALLELTTVVVMVLQTFDITSECKDKTGIREDYTFSMHPSCLPIKLVPREQAL